MEISCKAKVAKVAFPEGIVNNGSSGLFNSTRVLPILGGVDEGVNHSNTFEVVPNHTTNTVPSSTGSDGVCFNVETVPDALKKHLKKPRRSRQELVQGLQEISAEYYNRERQSTKEDDENMLNMLLRGEEPDQLPPLLTAGHISVEALSETKLQNIVHVGGNGFVMACMTAFAQHLPLTLTPDHVWILISYAFAKHVDQNAEALRENFVEHEGKKRLFVVTPADFAMSRNMDPDTGASAKDWETLVFPKISSQIQEHVGDKVHSVIAADFSTTTAAARAAHEITLMSAMKNYFSYGMHTLCGIPKITLLGSEEDWVSLRARAEQLGALMMPDFSKYWMPLLLPVLDEFVESYRGNVKHGFWQSMIKFRDFGGGSGSYSFLSGWIQLLFPYLSSGCLNQKLRPWQKMYFEGPKLQDFPLVSSVAPVDWNYYGCTYDLTFHAGVLGYQQDPLTGALSPLLGWFVSHVPTKPASLEIKDAEKEINDLLLGHKEEAAAETVDKSAPWYLRVEYLRNRIVVLDKSA
mmetsp:Transcript_10008/g.16622  ORF Transcript_10008/g.16622 Transcript_10008/m.16622 type:complete len:521 (-) Transcript_10008:180-1742(-)|eukprot:CAMPEP_0119018592 /NCGR_PEP_ID=MMETSP1176-20130426/19806_1 /TAXON_ID=265551 /ORGANISM="Synedropsis recta cf, Strain CCMP1620" /LENGTH=520 /DNA_ID=CAMNT_0006972623 /DNA_START=42 /DNA_END=1604 /DNA_ORIENTATION=-